MAVMSLLVGSELTLGDLLMNDSGSAAVALQVVFSEPVALMGLGGAFAVIEPSGAATSILLFGGTADLWASVWFTWEPAKAKLLSREWLADLPQDVAAEPAAVQLVAWVVRTAIPPDGPVGLSLDRPRLGVHSSCPSDIALLDGNDIAIYSCDCRVHSGWVSSREPCRVECWAAGAADPYRQTSDLDGCYPLPPIRDPDGRSCRDCDALLNACKTYAIYDIFVNGDGHGALHFSRDASLVESTTSDATKALVREVLTGKLLATLVLPSAWSASLTQQSPGAEFSPRGDFISFMPAGSNSNGFHPVAVYDISSGLPVGSGLALYGCWALGPGGLLAADGHQVGYDHYVARVFDVNSGELLQSLLAPTGTRKAVYPHRLLFSPDGRFLVAVGQTAPATSRHFVHVWSLENATLVASAENWGSASDVVANADLSVLAVSGPEQVTVYYLDFP
jgi:hypothetical protein